jgi:hypothetical protein
MAEGSSPGQQGWASSPSSSNSGSFSRFEGDQSAPLSAQELSATYRSPLATAGRAWAEQIVQARLQARSSRVTASSTFAPDRTPEPQEVHSPASEDSLEESPAPRASAALATSTSVAQARIEAASAIQELRSHSSVRGGQHSVDEVEALQEALARVRSELHRRMLEDVERQEGEATSQLELSMSGESRVLELEEELETQRALVRSLTLDLESVQKGFRQGDTSAQQCSPHVQQESTAEVERLQSELLAERRRSEGTEDRLVSQEKEIERLQSELLAERRRSEGTEDRLVSQEKEIERLLERVDQAERAAFDSSLVGGGQQARLQSELEGLFQELEAANGRFQASQSALAEAEVRVRQHERECGDLRSDAEALRERLQRMSTELEMASRLNISLRRDAEAARVKISELTRALEEVKRTGAARISTQRSEIDHCRGGMVRLEEENRELSEAKSSSQAKVRVLTTEMELMKQRAERAEMERDQLLDERGELSKRYDKAITEHAEAQLTIAKLKQATLSESSIVDSLRHEKLSLEQKLASLQELSVEREHTLSRAHRELAHAQGRIVEEQEAKRVAEKRLRDAVEETARLRDDLLHSQSARSEFERDLRGQLDDMRARFHDCSTLLSAKNAALEREADKSANAEAALARAVRDLGERSAASESADHEHRRRMEMLEGELAIANRRCIELCAEKEASKREAIDVLSRSRVVEKPVFVEREMDPPRVVDRIEENRTLRTSAERLGEENRTLRTSAERLEEENRTLRTSAERLGEENRTLRTSAERLDRDNLALRSQVASLEGRLEALRARYREKARATVQMVEREQSEWRRQLEQTVEAVRKAGGRREEALQQEVERLEGQVEEQRAELARSQGFIQGLGASKGRGSGLSASHHRAVASVEPQQAVPPSPIPRQSRHAQTATIEQSSASGVVAPGPPSRRSSPAHSRSVSPTQAHRAGPSRTVTESRPAHARSVSPTQAHRAGPSRTVTESRPAHARSMSPTQAHRASPSRTVIGSRPAHARDGPSTPPRQRWPPHSADGSTVMAVVEKMLDAERRASASSEKLKWVTSHLTERQHQSPHLAIRSALRAYNDAELFLRSTIDSVPRSRPSSRSSSPSRAQLGHSSPPSRAQLGHSSRRAFSPRYTPSKPRPPPPPGIRARGSPTTSETADAARLFAISQSASRASQAAARARQVADLALKEGSLRLVDLA